MPSSDRGHELPEERFRDEMRSFVASAAGDDRPTTGAFTLENARAFMQLPHVVAIGVDHAWQAGPERG